MSSAARHTGHVMWGRLLRILHRPTNFARSVDEVVFATALADVLAVGAPVSNALTIIREHAPLSATFRGAVEAMRGRLRSGYPLDRSLGMVAAVDPGLLAALHTGEELGCVVEELTAYANRADPNPRRTLARLAGRTPAAIEFAAALARLLRDRGLTVAVVEAAGRTVTAQHPRFQRALDHVVDYMQSGGTLDGAVAHLPLVFDPLYAAMLGLAETREQLRACLERLGSG